MGQFSLTHILILVIILLIFFGPSRLPNLGQSLGRAIRGFKQGLSGQDENETPAQLPEGSQSESTPTKSSQKDSNRG